MDGSGWTCDHSQKSHLKELVWLKEDELHQAHFPFLLLLLLFILFSLVSFFSIIIIIIWKLRNPLLSLNKSGSLSFCSVPIYEKTELDWYCQCFSAINFKNCQKIIMSSFCIKLKEKEITDHNLCSQAASRLEDILFMLHFSIFILHF